jgi:hypothetical protein
MIDLVPKEDICMPHERSSRGILGWKGEDEGEDEGEGRFREIVLLTALTPSLWLWAV